MMNETSLKLTIKIENGYGTVSGQSSLTLMKNIVMSTVEMYGYEKFRDKVLGLDFDIEKTIELEITFTDPRDITLKFKEEAPIEDLFYVCQAFLRIIEEVEEQEDE